jgi:hypothetical protein
MWNLHRNGIFYYIGVYSRNISFLFLFFIHGTALSEGTKSHYNDSSTVTREHLWSDGLLLLDSGKISKGLYILDSLYGQGVNDPATMSAYAKKVFRLLCPGRQTDSHIYVHDKFQKTVTDTLISSSFKCKIISSSSTSGRALPSFGYNIAFPVEKPYLLKFNGLQNRLGPVLKMGRETISTDLDYDLMDQISDKKDSISCSIFIDLKNSGLTIHDYISDYIYGVFDSIAIKTDLKKYNALSLRCYKRKSYGFESGKFTAIIAFDRLIPDRKGKKGHLTTTSLPVRYTVVVQSAASVRELAEAKLQTILKAL